MKIPIFPGKYHQHGGFSMAMLVYRRVSDSIYRNVIRKMWWKNLRLFSLDIQSYLLRRCFRYVCRVQVASQEVFGCLGFMFIPLEENDAIWVTLLLQSGSNPPLRFCVEKDGAVECIQCIHDPLKQIQYGSAPKPYVYLHIGIPSLGLPFTPHIFERTFYHGFWLKMDSCHVRLFKKALARRHEKRETPNLQNWLI